MLKLVHNRKEPPVFPWTGKQSIYRYIAEHLDENGVLPEECYNLPDDVEVEQVGELRWAPGALDGVISHHVGREDKLTERTRRVAALLKKQLTEPKELTRKRLYQLVEKGGVVEYIDALLEYLRLQPNLNYLRLYQEAIWFAKEGAHREVVKLGIALIGLFECEEQWELIATLGKHDEFTLFSVIAICNGMEDSNNKLLQLAKCLNGWGKIQLVERIEATTQEIKDWLLRDKRENAMVNEYLAYTCATKGELDLALSAEQIDRELYQGAGAILYALINGRIWGPMENIDDYEYAGQVVSDYLRHAREQSEEPGDFLVLNAIRELLEEDDLKWQQRYSNGWERLMREQCLAACRELMGDTKWMKIALATLDHTANGAIFNGKENRRNQAAQICRILQLDIWEKLFEQLSISPNDTALYYELMQTEEIGRVRRLVDFILQHVPFAEAFAVSANPLTGVVREVYQCIMFVLQDLDKFPGVGQELVACGLQSSDKGARYHALKALKAWPEEVWSAQCRSLMVELTSSESPED